MEVDLGALLERLQALEDQLAIYQVVSGYTYAVDGLNAEVVGDCYTEGAVYEIGDLGAYRGREGILGIVNDPGHGHIERVRQGVAHLAMLPHVILEGAEAVATSHLMVARHEDGRFGIWRLSASRLEFARQPQGGWKIVRRENHLLDGGPAGPALLARLLEGPDFGATQECKDA
jgi:ketosteroid isomerase-like protein